MSNSIASSNDDSPIHLVVFDLGRVLIRICDDWPHACRRAGVPFPIDTLDEANQAALHDFSRQHDIGEMDLKTFAGAAGPLLGMTPEQIQSASNAYLHAAYPGGTELIEELGARGIATACLSNTNESHWRMMNDPTNAAHVPLHLLTYRFASQLIGARKPDPAIYAHVERETGIAPEKIIFFDDVPENVEGATSRGWHAYQVDPSADDPIALIRTELRRRRILP